MHRIERDVKPNNKEVLAHQQRDRPILLLCGFGVLATAVPGWEKKQSFTCTCVILNVYVTVFNVVIYNVVI